MKTLRVQLVIGSLLFLAMGLLLFGGAVPVFASIGLEGRWTNLAPSVIGLSVGGYMVWRGFQGLALARRLRHGGELPETVRRLVVDSPPWVRSLFLVLIATVFVVAVLTRTQTLPDSSLLVLWACMFPVTLVAGLGIRRQKQRREERPAAPSHP